MCTAFAVVDPFSSLSIVVHLDAGYGQYQVRNGSDGRLVFIILAQVNLIFFFHFIFFNPFLPNFFDLVSFVDGLSLSLLYLCSSALEFVSLFYYFLLSCSTSSPFFL